MTEISNAIEALEAIMSTPQGSVQANFERYAALKKQLSDAENEWERHMTALDEMTE